MRIDSCKLAMVLLAAGALALAGCSGPDEISVAEAKEKLAVDCEQGRFGDRAHCRCLADELREGGRSGPQIDALREAINFGTPGAEVTQAVAACDARRRPAQDRAPRPTSGRPQASSGTGGRIR